MNYRISPTITRVQLMAAALSLGSAMPAAAHFPWVVPPEHEPAVGEQLTLHIGYGHDFSAGETLPRQRIEEISLVAPDGRQVPLEAHDDKFVSAPLKTQGPYIAAVAQKRNYYTRTAEDGIRAPKTEVAGALHCSYSGNTMKAIIGSEDSQLSPMIFGHPLEILPLTVPTSASAMKLRLLYRGKPYTTELELIKSSGETRTLTSRDDGTAEFQLSQGEWLVVASVQSDYPDKAKCDVESFTATLSFTIQQ